MNSHSIDESVNINELVRRRLDDMTDQYIYLTEQKDYINAGFLREQGLEFAKYADDQGHFFYADDLTHTLGE